MNEPIVEAQDLKKAFGAIVAVDGISFRMEKGECFGILGPNGAGKTSTIRMIYGMSPITAGTIRVFGRDISLHWRDIRERIGVCQQENNLDPDLSVAMNFEIFAGYFNIPAGEARRRGKELLDFMALAHRSEARVNELSGGMMRRLMLARALINNPDLLILDEPTTGLDPQSRHQVWERLGSLKAKGLTILLTTHYMDEAARLCDRLIIVDRGKILVEGSPLELIRRYVGDEVIEVADPATELSDYVVSQGLAHENLGHRLVIYSQAGNALFRKIAGTYCTEGCILRMATLEDVFLKLTGRDLRE